MLYLWIVSLLWAFSFGLIKGQLTGLDASFVAFARLFLAGLAFLPLLRLRGVDRRLALRLALIGAVQYGLMYVTYIYSFRFLKAYEVALFTIFTPLYVTLINDAYQRRLNGFSLLATVLAVAGTAIVQQANLLSPDLTRGFLIVQVSNLCFALGQVAYREVMRPYPHVRDGQVFGLLYIGGALAAGLPALFTTPWGNFTLLPNQALTLVYLGVVASALGFFLWNVGARRVNAGTLAIFNDLKIPLAVAVSLLFFGEQADLLRLLIGGGVVLAALALNEWNVRRRSAPQMAASTN